MKALILSGGEGTRLRPITHTSAKQLVPVANKPVLYYCLDAVTEAGIKDIGIIVGETSEEIIQAVGDGSQWNAKVTYIPQDKPLGLAHAVLTAKNFLGKSDFVMFLGDNLIRNGIKELVDEFNKTKPNAQILLAHVEEPQRFGVAELNDGKVVRLIEKPDDPPSDLALVGVYMFDNNIIKAAESIKPSGRNELEITDAIQYLIDNDFNVKPHIIDGWWKDTGRLEDMLEANRMILDDLEHRCAGTADEKTKLVGKVCIEEGAQIVNSVVRGPAIIGKNTIVKDSYIGPFTSIYFGCKIESSEIEHSIILEKSSISDMHRIEDSLIGKNVKIIRTDKKPKAYRLMLGDNSNVEVS